MPDVDDSLTTVTRTQGNNRALKDGEVDAGALSRSTSRRCRSSSRRSAGWFADARVRRLRDGDHDLPVRQGARRAVHRAAGLPGARLPPRRDRPSTRRPASASRRTWRAGGSASTAATRSPPASGRAASCATSTASTSTGHLGALRRRARGRVPAAARTSSPMPSGRQPRRPARRRGELAAAIGVDADRPERRAAHPRRRRRPATRARDARPLPDQPPRRRQGRAAGRATPTSRPICSTRSPSPSARYVAAADALATIARRTPTDRMHQRVMEHHRRGPAAVRHRAEPAGASRSSSVTRSTSTSSTARPHLETLFAAGTRDLVGLSRRHPPREVDHAHRHRRRPQRFRAQGSPDRSSDRRRATRSTTGAGMAPRMTSSTTRRCARTSAVGSSTAAPTAPSSSAAAARASTSPATRSAGSGPGLCHDRVHHGDHPAHTTTPTCWSSAPRSSHRSWPRSSRDLWLATAFKGGRAPGSARPDRGAGAIGPASTQCGCRRRSECVGVAVALVVALVIGEELQDPRGRGVGGLLGDRHVPVLRAAAGTPAGSARPRSRARRPGRARSGPARRVPSGPRARRRARCRGRTSPGRCPRPSDR